MNGNAKFFLTAIFFSFFIILTGCKENPTDTSTIKQDPTGSKTKSDQAYQMIENDMNDMISGHYNSTAKFDIMKFQSALSLYNEAVGLDTANTNARFGAAITEILSAYYDPEINKLVKEIDSSSWSGKTNPINPPMQNPLLPALGKGSLFPMDMAAGNIAMTFKLALNNPPLISRIQSVIETYFLPRLDRAINHLSVLESNTAFKFSITGKMQGDPGLDPVSLYVTEAGLMKAGLSFLKFNLQMFLLYNFTLPDYNQSSLLTALNQNNTNFFVLRSDGVQRGTAAKQTLSNIAASCSTAVNNLRNVSGNKSDALIKLNTINDAQKTLDTILVYLGKFKTVLNSDYTVTVKNADSDGKTYDITVNLGNFLTNPPQNPKKDLLPPYTVTPSGTKDIQLEFAAQTYNDFVFPDPAFKGLFPGMKSDTLKRLLYLDEVFAYKLSGHLNICGSYNSYYWGFDANIPVKITTNINTYTATTDGSGYFKFMIKNASASPQAITKYTFTYDGKEIECQLKGQTTTFSVAAKKSDWCSIYYILNPTNLTATRLSSSSVGLNFSVNNSSQNVASYYYKVQRKSGTSGFSDITSNYSYYYSSYIFTDPSVTSGTAYTYQILPKYEFGSSSYLIPTTPFIPSNSVTITP